MSKVKPVTMEQMLNPSAHGLEECPHCGGYGSSLKEDAEKCTVCGGAGLLPKKEADKYRSEHPRKEYHG